MNNFASILQTNKIKAAPNRRSEADSDLHEGLDGGGGGGGSGIHYSLKI